MENHPDIPSIRAFSPGAMSVFMKVWPVLKSLPQIGRLRIARQIPSTWVSVVRLGAPLAYGMPILSAA